jgi:hypothetical protein
MARNTISTNCLILYTALVVALGGCSGRNASKVSRTSTPPQNNSEYVDPQSGWRIRVVTPILKSGKFIVETQPVQSEGDAINVKASDDFVGYEITYYSVTPRVGGVLIRFASSEIIEDGKSVKQTRPLLPLFDLPPNMGFVRLLFLRQVSRADHSQGILAAPSLEQLAELTRIVEAKPEEGCRTNAETFCSWVPPGITAQAEKRDPRRRNKWIPAW